MLRQFKIISDLSRDMNNVDIKYQTKTQEHSNYRVKGWQLFKIVSGQFYFLVIC